MKQLEKALLIAIDAHRNQTDKSGEPYILHPFRVMLNVDSLGAKIVALLHDVVEDTDITLIKLEIEGFDEEIIDAIRAITKKQNEPNIDYLNRIMLNKLARVVKIRDIKDNLSPERMMNLDEKTQERLLKKYLFALNYLYQEML